MTARKRATAFALAALTAVTALVLPGASGAAGTGHDSGRSKEFSRQLVATDASGNLLSFRAGLPWLVKRTQITGLPAGVSLVGIDFRPATGDLYGVGSDSVVYRVNPHTAIAIAEGPAFAPALTGTSFGVDFNPTVDKIRVTSDANQNLRLDPDPGTVLMNDGALNPGDPNVVASAYLNSAFSATRPTATKLFAIDSVSDMLLEQNPPNAGTLINGKPLKVDVGSQTSFDIAGSDNVAYMVTQGAGKFGAGLYTVDLDTGKARFRGLVGNGYESITGFAAWQGEPAPGWWAR
jgi:Domain of unknown function (DUF4394)